MQKKLMAEQVAAFYHDGFVQKQVEDFRSMVYLVKKNKRSVVVDVGGGCGYFANAINRDLNLKVRVIDMDPVSVRAAENLGIDAICGDALAPKKFGDEAIVCFNLILHHLVCESEEKTLALQKKALLVWKDSGEKIFVNEYVYESFFSGFSGWIIYQITKSKILSALGKVVSNLVPSLRANTFGVGVRFRANREWRKIFEEAGFEVIAEIKGSNEFISLPRRLLFIKAIRRDSFLLSTT